ncbi:MAG: ASCH domain-containing protein [Phycisphaera sp.]|nr:MAG: ASCH domain-containing protein [Phycisphaera sp.]
MTPPKATTAVREHVAIVHPWVAEALLAGTKTIESRFSRDKRPPFGRIAKGADVYFRVAGGGYAVRASVGRVQSWENLTPQRVGEIEAEHRDQIGGDDAYWDAARNARCATLVHLERCEPVSQGPTLDRQRGDRRAWFVLG